MNSVAKKDELHWLMQNHHLSPAKMAEVCGVSIKTAYGWTTWNMTNSIPDRQLDKLKGFCTCK